MLANLLPGLREVRAPLVSGYLWLAFFYLALRDDLPSSSHPGPVLRPLFDLGQDLSAVGIATVTGVAAYLVGSAVQELLKLLGKVVSPGRPLYGEAGTRTSAAGRRDVEAAVQIKVQEIKRQLFQVALAPGEKGIDEEPSVATVERELPLIRTLLLGERPQLVGELDRLQAEADLRITVAFPLFFLAVFLAKEASLGWLVLAGPSVLLLVQGYQRHLEASDLLAKALRIGRAGAPSLETLESSAQAVLQRVELEGSLRQGMDAGDGLAAFRLGNLQASWDDYEAAVGSLEFACEKGIVRAYAELGLLHERRGHSDKAERAYRDGSSRGDEKAQSLLSTLLNSLEREEEARATKARAKGVESESPAPATPVPRPNMAEAAYRQRIEAGDSKAAVNLGLLLERTGQRESAIEALKRGTGIDPDDAQIWFELGKIEARDGRFRDAQQSVEEALRLQESDLGPDHLDLAETLELLAYAFERTGRYGEARAQVDRAYGIIEKATGPGSKRIVPTLNLLANCADSDGNYEESKKFLERAISLGEEHFGKGSVQVAQALGNLGHNAWQRGDYAAAKKYQERCLEVKREIGLGDSFSGAFTLSNLGSALYWLGDSAGAVELCREALQRQEEEAGSDDFKLYGALRDLGDALRGAGSPEESEEVLRRALVVAGHAQGFEPAETARILRSLAETQLALGEAGEAESTARKALAIEEEALRAEHPELARTLDLLAEICGWRGDDRAVAYRSRAARIRASNAGR